MKKCYAGLMISCFFCLFSVAAQELISAETYASYYGDTFNGKPTASGEIFNMNLYTAAHKTLPFGTLLEVTNLANGRKVIVRVNDRGPFIANRELDLSKAAAESLGMLNSGIARVSIKRAATPGQDYSQYPQAGNDPYRNTYPNSQNRNPYGVQPSDPYGLQENHQGTFQDSQRQRYVEQQFSQNGIDRNNGYPPAQEAQTPPAPQPVYTPAIPGEGAGILWRIQLGSFAREENALRLVVALRKVGFEPAYERAEGSVRVVLHGIRPADLDYVKRILKDGLFTDYIIRQENW